MTGWDEIDRTGIVSYMGVMKLRKVGMICSGAFSCIGMLVLILDAKTAMAAAIEGIELCIKTVIPALFPFFVLSGVLRNTMQETQMKILKPVGRLCGISDGNLHLLLIGLIGGYPVGAQYISQAYESGRISEQEAKRMLGFCNNAGPAFIFGICAKQFHSALAGWGLWLIHILSAVIAGILLPQSGQSRRQRSPTPANGKKLSVFEASVKSMAYVCGWVLLFRIVIGFLRRWVMWLFPTGIQVLLCGILELTNGCAELYKLDDDTIRFLLCVCMLNFGGLCVGMQTIAVTSSLKAGWHFPGKLLQAIIGAVICMVIYLFQRNLWAGIGVIAGAFLCTFAISAKKVWLFSKA